jgi:cob(I)alamin adenosyltransferase
MKKIFLLALCLTLTATLTACEKAPTAEIDAAKASIDAAVSEGAEQYTAEQLQNINAQLTAAMIEIKTQESKFLKDFASAKQMLAKVKVEADALKGQVAVAKEELHNQAVTALEQAGSAVAEAGALLANAPRGKGSQDDIEARKADISGLDAALLEVQPLIEAGDYQAAISKTDAVSSRAAEISSEIRIAQEKMAALKK